MIHKLHNHAMEMDFVAADSINICFVYVAHAIALLAMSLHQSVVLMDSHTLMSVHCNAKTALKTEKF